MMYLQLFWVFFQIGLLSFGGGYAAMPLIEELVVNQYQWISETQFLDIITISESTPGPIAINTATFVGMQLADFPGAVIATTANVLPSFVITLMLAYLFMHYRELEVVEGIFVGIRPAVIALILSAAITILMVALFGHSSLPVQLSEFSIESFAIFIAALILIMLKDINPIYVMLISGVIGLLLFY